jgi:uncharacterized protein DUF3833
MNQFSRQCMLLAPLLSIASPPAPAATPQVADPLRFFAGRTETKGMVKVLFKKPYQSRSLGQGKIEADGSLTLVQRVEDDGKPPHERRWRVRRVGPGRYVGTMSEASGPVDIEQVGDGYRFRFSMKGHLNVEQWLTPLAGATAAHTSTKVRKFGMTVATTEGTVRKLNDS